MNTLRDIKQTPVATQLYPPAKEPLTLKTLFSDLDGTGTALNEDFNRRWSALEQARQLGAVPIVGVCGTVNSGKSTIVAGFLSEKGSARVLIGELDKEGTHRFVFWLPAAWRANGLGEEVEQMIRNTTGTSPEKLAEDSAEAAMQYNATRDRMREFNIPLIAYDPRLDESGIAFLDCPDTQRSLDDKADEFTANLRLERLRTIVPMCSAFVVVVSMQQMGSEETGKVFKAISEASSEAPLYFVLNMTKSDDVEVYEPEVQSSFKKWKMTAKVRRSYLSPTMRPRTPDARITPVVTSMDEEHSSLECLATELVPAELQRGHRLSCVNRLKALFDDVAVRVRKRHKDDRRLVLDARDRVGAFLSQKLIDAEGNPRALEFTEAARQIAESIQRTAPIGIRIALAPGKWLRELTSKWKFLNSTEKDLERFQKIEPADFSNFLLGSRFLRPEVTALELDVVWKQAFDGVLAEGKKQRTDPRELEETARRMWSEVPFGKKMALLKNVIIATSAIAVAGLLLPFDGGLSIIVVAKAHLVLGGTEILAMVLGGPMVATLLSSKEAGKWVAKFEQEYARPQIDSLYAGLADGLGIPRELDGLPSLQSGGKVCHAIKASSINTLPDKVGVLGHPLVCLDEEAWEKMVTTSTCEAL